MIFNLHPNKLVNKQTSKVLAQMVLHTSTKISQKRSFLAFPNWLILGVTVHKYAVDSICSIRSLIVNQFFNMVKQ